MSSLISDIFYNPKNNALFDNYLQNRDATNSAIIPPLQLEGSELHSHNNITTQPQYRLTFKITIYEEYKNGTMKRQQSKNASRERKQTIKKGVLHRVSLKLGAIIIQQYVQCTHSHILVTQIQFQLLLDDIVNHPAFCIELIGKSKLQVPIGCSYLPTENIKEMINKGIRNKIYNLSMKGVYGKEDGSKLKVKCEVEIYEKNEKKYKSHNNQSIDDQYEQSQQYFNVRQHSRQPSNKQGVRISNYSSKSNPHKPYDNKIINRRISDDNTSKIQSKLQYGQEREQRVNQWSELLNKSKSTFNYINDSENYMMKVQLENKTIKFVIKDYKPHAALKSTIKSTNEQNSMYKFMINSNKIFSINEQIILHASQIGKKGIRITVLKVQSESQEQNKIEIGYFHLNIIILFSGYISGVFPVNNEENQCIGLVRLDSGDGRQGDIGQQSRRVSIEQRINTGNREEQSLSIQLPHKLNGLHINGYLIQFSRVYCLSPQKLTKLSVNSLPLEIQTIVRINNNLIKISKQCQIKSVHIFSQQQLIQIVYKEPILISQQQMNRKYYTNMIVEIEIEIYVNLELVGYTKLEHCNQINYKNKYDVLYNSVLANMTTNGYICHASINYIHFNIPIDYFPADKLKESMRCAIDWKVIGLVRQKMKKSGKLDKSQIQGEMIQYMMNEHKGLIYIQAHRIASIVLASLLAEKYMFIYPHNYNQNQHHPTSTSISKQISKLLQEMHYLDGQSKGIVDIDDIKSIASYYGLSTQLYQSIRVGYINGLMKDMERKKDVLYLFALAGEGFNMYRANKLELEMRNRDQARSQDSNKEKQTNNANQVQKMEEKSLKKENEQKKIIEQPKQQAPIQQNPSQQSLHIESIACFQMHNLMPGNSIPSIKIKLPSSSYCSKTYYSSANPVVRLNRKISQGQPIIILHNNIKLGQDIEICKFVYTKGKLIYDLGEGASVKLLIIGKM